MGVTIELQNLGDTDLCRDISALIEHAFAERQGDWHVSIIGSRASGSWEMRIKGPHAFERSYSLTAAAGEHEPDAIRRLIIRMLPPVSA